MKTLISTLALAAGLAAPVAALADTPSVTPAAQLNATTTAVQAQRAAAHPQPVSTTPTVAPTRVALQSKNTIDATGYMQQANDDRQGFARLQASARQLGATN